MITYLDSSAIVKLYLVDEAGTADLKEVASGSARIATSRLSYVEVRAGLAAAHRADRFARPEHDRAVASFEDSWPAYFVVELTEVVGARAGVMAGAFGLRAGDAIQLASLFELDVRETVMVAWDARLRSASHAAGVAVYPVTI